MNSLSTEAVISRLESKTRKLKMGSWFMFIVVVCLVAFGNFAFAFLEIDGLEFAELSNVIVVGSAGGGGLAFWPMLALSVLVVGGIVGGVGFWNVRRSQKRDGRVVGGLKSGQRLDAKIQSATKSKPYPRGQMHYTRLEITASCSDGQSYSGEVEEPVGTELPIVQVDEAAAVWVHGAGSIIVTANGVFESGTFESRR